MFKNIGPGILVAAAFIGPGTITICTLAGVNFGYALLWAMLLSVVATVVLQEMAARLGIVTQKGLTSLLREEIPNRLVRTMVLGIILAAIVIGNTAYEAGNISGATLGLEALFGSGGLAYYPWIIGGLAFALLFIGSYKVLEKTFITLVGLMSLSFVITAILTNASITGILKGLFTPEIPSGSLLTIIALIGTTVVPYNLFLHASLVREKWSSVSDLSKARKDTLFSVMLGGFVSMAVIIAATAIPKDEISNALDMAKSLEPLYGNAASVFMGIGLFAAGITSSITAPLAAAYVVNNCFGWNATMKDPRFRMVWMIVLLIGAGSLSLQIRPIEIIQFAQVANGLLLPLIAVTLLWMINRKELMGINKNALWQNVLSLMIIGIVFLLGIKSIFVVFTD
ncbi:MAG: Nramp family divalent metal transporter [Flavobacteriaceae bacterium]